MKQVRKGDILGIDTTLYFSNDDKQVKSFYGGFISLIIISLMLCGGGYFFYQFINRNNFTLVSNLDTDNNISYKNFSEIPFMIRLSGSNSTAYPSNYYTPYLMLYTYNESISNKQVIENIELEKCDINKSIIKEKHHIFSSINNIESYYCPKWNGRTVNLIGLYGSTSFNYLLLKFYVCGSYYLDINCPNDQTIREMFSSTYVDFITITNKVNHYSDVPNIEQIYKARIPSSYSIFKRIWMYYQEIKYENDNGYIFEVLQKTVFNMVYDYESDMDLRPANNGIIWFTMINYSYSETYTRSYMKAQTLLANIGGIIKGLSIVGFILNFPVANNLYNLKMINTVYDKENSFQKVLLKSKNENKWLLKNYSRSNKSNLDNNVKQSQNIEQNNLDNRLNKQQINKPSVVKKVLESNCSRNNPDFKEYNHSYANIYNLTKNPRSAQNIQKTFSKSSKILEKINDIERKKSERKHTTKSNSNCIIKQQKNQNNLQLSNTFNKNILNNNYSNYNQDTNQNYINLKDKDLNALDYLKSVGNIDNYDNVEPKNKRIKNNASDYFNNLQASNKQHLKNKNKEENSKQLNTYNPFKTNSTDSISNKNNKVNTISSNDLSISYNNNVLHHNDSHQNIISRSSKEKFKLFDKNKKSSDKIHIPDISNEGNENQSNYFKENSSNKGKNISFTNPVFSFGPQKNYKVNNLINEESSNESNTNSIKNEFHNNLNIQTTNKEISLKNNIKISNTVNSVNNINSEENVNKINLTPQHNINNNCNINNDNIPHNTPLFTNQVTRTNSIQQMYQFERKKLSVSFIQMLDPFQFCLKRNIKEEYTKRLLKAQQCLNISNLISLIQEVALIKRALFDQDQLCLIENLNKLNPNMQEMTLAYNNIYKKGVDYEEYIRKNSYDNHKVQRNNYINSNALFSNQNINSNKKITDIDHTILIDNYHLKKLINNIEI